MNTCCFCYYIELVIINANPKLSIFLWNNHNGKKPCVVASFMDLMNPIGNNLFKSCNIIRVHLILHLVCWKYDNV